MEILTYSRIKARKNCPMAEHLRYTKQLVSKFRKPSLDIGTAVHKGLETGSIEKALKTFVKPDVYPTTQAEADQLETNRALVTAMLTGYLARYEPFDSEKTQNEIKFDIPIINPKTKATSKSFTFQGKVDALTIIDGQYWLVEYKTSGKVDNNYFERLEIDDQITSYIYALQRTMNIKIAGVIYRVIKKPGIKQTQKETLAQYHERLLKDYQERPDFYYFESKFYRSQEDLAKFENDLWYFTQQLLYEKRQDINTRNASRCMDFGTCTYFPICTNQVDAELLFTTKPPHEELSEEENGGE